jgi:hypothetical protein
MRVLLRIDRRVQILPLVFVDALHLHVEERLRLEGDAGALGDARVLLETNRVLIERARREVVVDFRDSEAVGGEVEGCCQMPN